MYAILCTRSNICYKVVVVVVASQYQLDIRNEHWTAVKHMNKYVRRMRGYMLVYSTRSLESLGYTHSDFQRDINSTKSTSNFLGLFDTSPPNGYSIQNLQRKAVYSEIYAQVSKENKRFYIGI